jgi:hypothetical protein
MLSPHVEKPSLVTFALFPAFYQENASIVLLWLVTPSVMP